MRLPSSRKSPGAILNNGPDTAVLQTTAILEVRDRLTIIFSVKDLTINDFDRARRLLRQLEPLEQALAELRKAHQAGLKEPPGHPNMHPVRAAMKNVETELERALGQIARSRRDDELERQRRQERYNKK